MNLIPLLAITVSSKLNVVAARAVVERVYSKVLDCLSIDNPTVL